MPSHQEGGPINLPAQLNGNLVLETDEGGPMPSPQLQMNGESSHNGVDQADAAMVSDRNQSEGKLG